MNIWVLDNLNIEMISLTIHLEYKGIAIFYNDRYTFITCMNHEKRQFFVFIHIFLLKLMN